MMDTWTLQVLMFRFLDKQRYKIRLFQMSYQRLVESWWPERVESAIPVQKGIGLRK